VYSFGIVVLEIISGRKSIDPQKSGEEIYLREWVRNYYLSFLISYSFEGHLSSLILVFTKFLL